MSKDRFFRNKDLCQPTSKRMFTSRGLVKEKETWKWIGKEGKYIVIDIDIDLYT